MDVYQDYVNKLKVYFKGKNVKNLFLHGGCYFFAKNLVKKLKGGRIYWNRKLMHCAVLYDKQLYDFTGKISKKDFIPADESAIKYMEKHFVPDFDVQRLQSYLNA